MFEKEIFSLAECFHTFVKCANCSQNKKSFSYERKCAPFPLKKCKTNNQNEEQN